MSVCGDFVFQRVFDLLASFEIMGGHIFLWFFWLVGSVCQTQVKSAKRGVKVRKSLSNAVDG